MGESFLSLQPLLLRCTFQTMSCRNSNLKCRKKVHSWKTTRRLRGALCFPSPAVSVQWGTDFFVCVAAAVWLHAVAPDHLTYRHKHNQLTAPCSVPLHRCSCSLTWTGTQRHIQHVPTVDYTCTVTCIHSYSVNWQHASLLLEPLEPCFCCEWHQQFGGHTNSLSVC